MARPLRQPIRKLNSSSAYTPVTIGLDVLEQLIIMAKPQNKVDDIYLSIAEEALVNARVYPEHLPPPHDDMIDMLTSCMSDPFRHLEPKG